MVHIKDAREKGHRAMMKYKSLKIDRRSTAESLENTRKQHKIHNKYQKQRVELGFSFQRSLEEEQGHKEYLRKITETNNRSRGRRWLDIRWR